MSEAVQGIYVYNVPAQTSRDKRISLVYRTVNTSFR